MQREKTTRRFLRRVVFSTAVDDLYDAI